jgi:hypothetical protein
LVWKNAGESIIVMGVNLTHKFSRRDALWLVSVIVIAFVWHLDRTALRDQLDSYQSEFALCHDKLDRLEKELAQFRAPAAPVRQPRPSWMADPTPDPFKIDKDLFSLPLEVDKPVVPSDDPSK